MSYVLLSTIGNRFLHLDLSLLSSSAISINFKHSRADVQMLQVTDLLALKFCVEKKDDGQTNRQTRQSGFSNLKFVGDVL